jgi:DNA-binding IclR family transcriptional regulator
MADQTNLPDAFLSTFTAAELRVIHVIFAAISAEGRCTKRLDEIARLAEASRSTARNSIKQAVSHGLLERRERRFATAVSASNILTAPAMGARNRDRVAALRSEGFEVAGCD